MIIEIFSLVGSPELCIFVQQVYDEPTVIVAQRVTGEEEVPEGAVAVLTPDAPDVLSHVSVRARNMRVLFAVCHDAEELAQVCDEFPKHNSFHCVINSSSQRAFVALQHMPAAPVCWPSASSTKSCTQCPQGHD